MAFQKNQKVYLKRIPRLIYGTVVNTIDEGPGQDPSVIVQPSEIRCHESDLESAELPELPESLNERLRRVMSGPLGRIPEQWAANPENPEFRSQMFDLLRELGVIKPLPPK
jgi:hypothetical protein